MANTAFAAQTIQISAQIAPTSPASELIFMIDDIDSGKKTPNIMSLKPGQNFQMFHVDGNHYRITLWTIQAPNLTFSPCAPSSIINNHSLVVTLNGNITENGLHCVLRETTALMQLTTPSTTLSPINTTNITTNTSNNTQSSYAEIANYLTALGKQCQPGEFHAKFNEQNIDYSILGTQTGACKVAISVNKEKPLLCNFNDNDIALLTSSSEIERYKAGNVENSPNSLTTRIMNARCKPM